MSVKKYKGAFLTHHLSLATGIIFVILAFKIFFPIKHADAGPVIVAQDNFTRPDQTHWGKASDGQLWGSNASFMNIFSINSNTGQVIGDGTGNTYSGVLGPTVTDAEVLTTVYVDSTYQDSSVGPILRWSNNGNFYKAFIGSTNNIQLGSCYHSSGTWFVLLKEAGGKDNALTCVAFGANPGTTYSIRFQVVGQTLNAKAWQGGSEPGWMLTYTDPAFASGRAGVRSVNNNGAVAHFTSFITYDLTVPPLYTISGTVFQDNDGDGIYQKSTESVYAGSGQQIHIVQQGGGIDKYFNVDATNGTYTSGQILPVGTYTVSYTGGPPGGFFMTEPVNGPPPSFNLIVGVPCTPSSTGASKNAVCNSGDITDADYGITNIKPWTQNFCGDMRVDAGISDNIPASPICGSVSGAYALQTDTAVCTNPGIAYTGSSNAFFNSGTASSQNWQVGGNPPNDVPFKAFPPGVIKSSYEYISSTIKKNGITPTDLIASGICSNSTPSVCDFSTKTLTHGIYTVNKDIILTAANYTFPAGQNFVYLITGSMTIKGQIHVPVGSTAIFSASGDITVDPSVGESSSLSRVTDIEGLYSADGSFNTPGASSCNVAIADKRLNIAGSVVVNAGYKSPRGTFASSRDLCTGDNKCPVVTFSQRPDFIFYAPRIIKVTSSTWQELAP